MLKRVVSFFLIQCFFLGQVFGQEFIFSNQDEVLLKEFLKESVLDQKDYAKRLEIWTKEFTYKDPDISPVFKKAKSTQDVFAHFKSQMKDFPQNIKERQADDTSLALFQDVVKPLNNKNEVSAYVALINQAAYDSSTYEQAYCAAYLDYQKNKTQCDQAEKII